MKDKFSEKVYKEIKAWSFAISIIPLSLLALIFFIWMFGTKDILHMVMVAGATAMFTIAVIWWFWALHTIKNLVDKWDSTKDRVTIILHEIKTVREIISEKNRDADDK